MLFGSQNADSLMFDRRKVQVILYKKYKKLKFCHDYHDNICTDGIILYHI